MGQSSENNREISLMTGGMERKQPWCCGGQVFGLAPAFDPCRCRRLRATAPPQPPAPRLSNGAGAAAVEDGPGDGKDAFSCRINPETRPRPHACRCWGGGARWDGPADGTGRRVWHGRGCRRLPRRLCNLSSGNLLGNEKQGKKNLLFSLSCHRNKRN